MDEKSSNNLHTSQDKLQDLQQDLVKLIEGFEAKTHPKLKINTHRQSYSDSNILVHLGSSRDPLSGSPLKSATDSTVTEATQRFGRPSIADTEIDSMGDGRSRRASMAISSIVEPPFLAAQSSPSGASMAVPGGNRRMSYNTTKNSFLSKLKSTGNPLYSLFGPGVSRQPVHKPLVETKGYDPEMENMAESLVNQALLDAATEIAKMGELKTPLTSSASLERVFRESEFYDALTIPSPLRAGSPISFKIGGELASANGESREEADYERVLDGFYSTEHLQRPDIYDVSLTNHAILQRQLIFRLIFDPTLEDIPELKAIDERDDEVHADHSRRQLREVANLYRRIDQINMIPAGQKQAVPVPEYGLKKQVSFRERPKSTSSMMKRMWEECNSGRGATGPNHPCTIEVASKAWDQKTPSFFASSSSASDSSEVASQNQSSTAGDDGGKSNRKSRVFSRWSILINKP